MTFEETSLHRKWSDLYWIGYRATNDTASPHTCSRDKGYPSIRVRAETGGRMAAERRTGQEEIEYPG